MAFIIYTITIRLGTQFSWTSIKQRVKLGLPEWDLYFFVSLNDNAHQLVASLYFNQPESFNVQTRQLDTATFRFSSNHSYNSEKSFCKKGSQYPMSVKAFNRSGTTVLFNWR
ncbi:hypothetical protein ACF0H5_006222 [Mactra antiquata]